MKKRILAFLLTVMMVVTLMPLSAYASFIGDIVDGVEDIIDQTKELIDEKAGGGGGGGGGSSAGNDSTNTSTLTFKIVNGTWDDDLNTYGGVLSEDKTEVTFTLIYNSYVKGYVYKCANDKSAGENTAEDFINWLKKTTDKPYIPDEGYEITDDVDWAVENGGTVYAGTLTNVGNANAQMNAVISNGHNYDDHMAKDEKMGFAANTVYVLTLVKKSYTVTYKVDGVQDGAVENHAYNTEVTVRTEPVREGYTFSGWSSEQVNVDSGKFTMPAKDVVITGSFEANPYDYVIHHVEKDNESNTLAPDTTGSADFGSVITVADKAETIEGFTYDSDTGDITIAVSGNEATIYYSRDSYNYVIHHVEKDNESNTLAPDTTGSADFGSVITVEDKAETIEGFTYDSDTGDITIAVSGNEATIYYSRDSYKVTYEYTGTVPTGAPAVPDPAEYKYGETVTVEVAPSLTGYTFSGWSTTDAAVSEGTFTMPANAVTLKGHFNPADGTAYKIEYYLENLDGTGYDLNAAATENFTAKTNSPVEVTDTYKKTFLGFTFDEDNDNNVLSGTVAADGSLVLKLYYTRNSYKVTYEYTGTVPKDATKLPADASYKYGETVTVAKKATATGYTFDGWNTVAKIELTNGTFEMPADNVMFYGSFAPADTTYTVKHYLETGYNTNDYTLEETEVIGGVTGEETKASAKSYDGYVAQAFEQKIVEADGSTVVEIYYDVQKADTYTVTYIVDDKIVGEVEVYEAGDIVTVRKTLPDKQFYTFEGWYFPTYITVKNNKFEMPARDVIIRGEYKYEGLYIPPITEGYIEIEKELTAPKGYTGATTFTFEIYKDGNDDDDLYTTIRVKAGESQKIKVDVGTYYIYEIDAEEEGYTLTTGCNAQNNRIRVEGGKTRTVTFKNVYTEEILLEKDDHFGYIIGYPDDTVRPESNITRAEIATIFFRMLTDESRDAYWCQTNDFTDVSRTDWFNNAVSTLANAGILSGYADGSFRPNASITRAELVKIAVAFYGSDAAVEADFSDTEDHWADMFINAAYGLGFVNGYEDGSFRPDQAVTRAEAMKIINRSLGRYPTVYGLHGDMIIWKDNRDKSAWYYADVQEATNSHEYVWETDTAEDWTDILPVRDWAALEKVYSDAYDG